MKRSSLVALVLSVAACSFAADESRLNEHLEPLRPFLGITWRGVFKDSKPEKPMVDVSRWERALNGQAVRILHSVNDGDYGGESIIYWDKQKTNVAYHYFTTAGFTTSGTMTFSQGKITAVEKVLGNTNGVVEVRSTWELRPDGTLATKAAYVKDGRATSEREIIYKPDPHAEVKFK